MVDKNELSRRLMATFLEELHDNVGVLNQNLLSLEKVPSSEQRTQQINEIFRCAHTVKGAARAVNIELIEQACHSLEDILAEVRDGQRDLTGELFSLLFKSVDAIEEAGMRLREEQDLSGAPLEALLPQLTQAAMGQTPGPRSQGSPGESRGATNTAKAQPEVIAEGSSESQELEEGTTSQSTEASVHANTIADAPARSATELRKGGSSSATIRVAAEKLDSLLAQTGELLVARRRVEYRAQDVASLRELVGSIWSEWREVEKPLRMIFDDERLVKQDRIGGTRHISKRGATIFARMSQRLAQLEKEAERLEKNMVLDGRVLGQTCDALDDEVYWVRMLPFAEACSGLERVVRDIAQTTGKQVELVIEGEDVEVNRSVLEGLKDPLIHLVRNAVDHGIEPANVRTEKGNNPTAKITVSAALRGGQVEVVVSDDGRGFDLKQIREKVSSRGLTEPQDDRELLRMIFLPGFSTAPIVTDVSGRGVGLDVVESRIQSLHGAVDVSFIPGMGSRFEMTVPLTLTTIRCLITSAGGQTFAIPTANVRQIVRFQADVIRPVGGREMLLLGESPVPISFLANTLGQQQTPRRGGGEKLLAIVLSVGGVEVAFIVDEVASEQDVLVKNLGSRVRRIRHVSGATLLPSGKVALVLNTGNIVRTALDRPIYRQLAAEQEESKVPTQKRLLIVEDSITTRTLMKSILEASGYEVTAAVDGQQALELLEHQEVDLVVSDVDMPRTNGFDLTRTIRSSERMNQLPVVLVTARETDEDKARGIQVGANAYLVKRSFDQENLLKTIEQLL